MKTATNSARIPNRKGSTRPRPWRKSCAALFVVFTIAVLAAQCLATSAAVAANYALLINGDPTFSHAHNVEIATDALTKLGYPAANILTAASNGDIRSAVRELEHRISAEDVLLVYTTGHGDRRGSESRLFLRQGDIGATDLARLIFGLKFARLIYIGDQCYSGGFATAFGTTTRTVVAVTATDDTHRARCEPFVRPLWRAAVAEKASIEAAYREGSASAKKALDASPESNTRYLATGAAAGHENTFAG